MNITVKVDEISLSTAVGEIASEYDYENECVTKPGGPATVAHLVAEMIVDRLVQDRDRWYELRQTVTDVKREAIREAVRPMIEQAISEPIRKTNGYGDPVGETTVTLREVIVDEARKVINAKDPNDYRDDKGTFLVRVVREEVSNALRAEIAAEVAKAKSAVADEIGRQVAAAVTNAMKGR